MLSPKPSFRRRGRRSWLLSLSVTTAFLIAVIVLNRLYAAKMASKPLHTLSSITSHAHAVDSISAAAAAKLAARRTQEVHEATSATDPPPAADPALMTAAPQPHFAESLKRRRATADEQRDAVDSLLYRILGEEGSQRFLIDIKPAKANATDSFAATCFGGSKPIRIEATSGVAAAYGVHQVLKQKLTSGIFWGVGRTGIQIDAAAISSPSLQPFKMHSTSPMRHRHYYNARTFVHTTAFWEWEEWEREIDWMALHGVNLPLAFVGQEIVWYRLWLKNGLSDKDIMSRTSEVFPGQHRTWGGAVDAEFLKRRRDLQHKILLRMRQLGIRPVLPAFSGHIPEALADRLPILEDRNASRAELNRKQRASMPQLAPTSPEYVRISAAFTTLLVEEFGRADYYLADAFNEVPPARADNAYLAAAGKNVADAIRQADPDGKWMVQGRAFQQHPHTWSAPAVASYLSQGGDALVLDLAADLTEVWRTTDGFAGHGFVWCMLHNFGGRRGIYGDAGALIAQTQRARREAKTMVGLGMTMEATHHNPFIFELFSDLMWDPASVTTLSAYIQGYVAARYGTTSAPSAIRAFELLTGDGGPYATAAGFHFYSPISVVPSLERHSGALRYNATALVHAYLALEQAKGEGDGREITAAGYQYDRIDFLRQILENLFADHSSVLASVVGEAKGPKPSTATIALARNLTATLSTIILDVDKLLTADPNFALAQWVSGAMKWLSSKELRAQAFSHAKRQVTLWGDGLQGPPNYAVKAWSGVYRGVYKARWDAYFKRLLNALESGEKVNPEHVLGDTVNADMQWSQGEDDGFADHEEVNTGALPEMHRKYMLNPMEGYVETRGAQAIAASASLTTVAPSLALWSRSAYTLSTVCSAVASCTAFDSYGNLLRKRGDQLAPMTSPAHGGAHSPYKFEGELLFLKQ